MGGGLGHLTRLKPFVQSALEAGHEVSLVVKELANIRAVYETMPHHVFQAPYETTPGCAITPISWPEMLMVRYGRSKKLSCFLEAWYSILDLVNPDLVIYDASPTALLASLEYSCMKWTVGGPFFMPRTDMPFVGIMPNASGTPDVKKRLHDSERTFLDVVNQALIQTGRSAIANVKDIIEQMDKQLLTTIPELDYFGARSIGDYVGMPPSDVPGIALPPWPAAARLKVFAYLKIFPGWETFLEDMEAIGLPALIYTRDASNALKGKLKRHIFLESPASMDEVCSQADLVVHMAGSQTVARCLHAGVPQLMIGTGLEQIFTAKAAEKIGAGLVLKPSKSGYGEQLEAAIALAKKGRIKFPKERREMLDGAYFNSHVRAFMQELSL
ncbi:nucleotide disphospho-sugar-binding domain-containing protein [Synechococcus sp. CCY9201]|uniref:glycosyltransferase n=1 Tax=Synechococcus sp. CCY9201 TaxID=174697 RepID=UPI002B20822A|nr:nucleotide disphospho-sugar-binding domain-containing protein [Synechococcus sp. CCY9201]MEA5472741.1 nucleotide disphospho-sugar-binding domain-containing protein [Synechococcus sp. CCY9201]